jgi:hypothetical protein
VRDIRAQSPDAFIIRLPEHGQMVVDALMDLFAKYTLAISTSALTHCVYESLVTGGNGTTVCVRCVCIEPTLCSPTGTVETVVDGPALVTATVDDDFEVATMRVLYLHTIHVLPSQSHTLVPRL